MPLEQVYPGHRISMPSNSALAIMRVAAVIDSSGSGRAGYAAGTATPLVGGICNKITAAGEATEVQIGGVARLVAGAAVSVGAYVGSQTDGFAIAVTAVKSAYVGIALTAAGGTADVFECLISPGIIV